MTLLLYGVSCFFFFNAPPSTVIYTYLPTLPQHDALPIYLGLVICRSQAVDGEGRQHRQAARIDRPLRREAERAPCRKLIVQAAAEQLLHAVAAQGPEDLGARRLALQLHEREGGVDRRVASADHEDAPAGIARAFPSGDIGDAIGDRSEEPTSEPQSLMRH